MTIDNSSLAYSPHVCSFPSLLHFLVLWDKLPVAEIIRSFKVRKGLWFMYPISSPCLPPILFRAALTASLQSLSIQVCEKIELGFLFVCVPWWFHFYINCLSSPFCFTWLRIFVENLLYGFVHCLLATFHHSSVAQLCPTLRNSIDFSMQGFPVRHQLLEPTQTNVHWVGDAIHPSHPLLSPSPPAFNVSQHQGLFQWIGSSHHVAKLLEFHLQHQSFQFSGLISFRID